MAIFNSYVSLPEGLHCSKDVRSAAGPAVSTQSRQRRTSFERHGRSVDGWWKHVLVDALKYGGGSSFHFKRNSINRTTLLPPEHVLHQPIFFRLDVVDIHQFEGFHGDSPLAGWFIVENPIYKWMMNGGTPCQTCPSGVKNSMGRWSRYSPPPAAALFCKMTWTSWTMGLSMDLDSMLPKGVCKLAQSNYHKKALECFPQLFFW